MGKNRFIAISIIIVFSVIGCKEKTAAPPQKPSNAVVSYISPVPPAAVPSDTNKTEENTEKIERETTRRNPFKPIVSQNVLPVLPKSQVKSLVTKPFKPQTENLTPLQKYEIEKLKLVAIIWGEDGSVAMMELPDGKGYTIRIGDLIGNRGGRYQRF